MPNPSRGRLAKQRTRSDALLLKRVELRDVDLIVHLFTEELGSVSAIARGARRSSKRLSSLEPMHLLRVSVDIAPGRELATLTEASLSRPRVRLTTNLAAMTAAGRALRWLRRAAPPRTPEPGLWLIINELLDALDAEGDLSPDALLGVSGLQMLTAAGWGLELERCVRCGKLAPDNARAVIDVRAGGIVCRQCGGMGPVISSRRRALLVRAQRSDPEALADPEVAEIAITMVDQAFSAHGRGEAT